MPRSGAEDGGRCFIFNGAEVSASGLRIEDREGPRFKSHPRLTSQS